MFLRKGGPVAGPPPAAGSHLALHGLGGAVLQRAHQPLLLALWKVSYIPQCYGNKACLVLDTAVQCSAVQCSAVQCSAVQCS
jgi:hypothetical protein